MTAVMTGKLQQNGFSGFDKDALVFLAELKQNNNRDWFNANKTRYKMRVVEPMTDFIRAIAPGLNRISSAFIANPKTNGGSMFRIYRDTRFSKDKKPYKENYACHFRHNKGRDAHAPGFYVHIEPETVWFGGGIWAPPTPVLRQIRATIDEEPDAWERIISDNAFVTHFGSVRGDQLKRVPKEYSADHRHAEDLRRKTFFAGRTMDSAVILSPVFVDEVLESFAAAAPMMEFLCAALVLDW